MMETEDNNGGSSPSTPPASPDLETDDDEICTSNYDTYPFAVEDSDQNILFEDKEEGAENIRKVKGGTLPKLVERLTYAAYPGTSYYIPLFFLSLSLLLFLYLIWIIFSG